MNKVEALEYLVSKRKVTAPVAQALNAKNDARQVLIDHNVTAHDYGTATWGDK